MKVSSCVMLIMIMFICSCSSIHIKKSEEQLLRIPYTSFLDNSNREYFLYLPKGYKESDKNWPILMFLHGNGERGNGKNDLDYVQIHGPLYEAWVQKRDLPFIIIAPQLHMFDLDKQRIDYITNRTKESIPKRLKNGTPKRPKPRFTSEKLNSFMSSTIPETKIKFINKYGWNNVQEDLINIIDNTLQNFKADDKRVYLTGLSFGGYGTWHTASKYPDKFAAINPIVGFVFPDLIKSIAENKTPIWNIAGGKDKAVPSKYFYTGINKLKELGHHKVRLTVHEDTDHVETWRRVYAGQDIYDWLLSHSK